MTELTLSIDLNIELYTSVIVLYDADTVSPVRVEIWKEIIFIFFYYFRNFHFFCFHFFHPLTPGHRIFQTKKLNHTCIFYENEVESN